MAGVKSGVVIIFREKLDFCIVRLFGLLLRFSWKLGGRSSFDTSEDEQFLFLFVRTVCQNSP